MPWSLIVFIILAAAAAVFGTMFPPGEWYQSLVKPGWTPPNWLFGPVWTVLYVMIAVSGWLVWRQQQQVLPTVVVLWGLQMVLNAAWSWLFFGLENPAYALVDIGLMLVAIITYIIVAWPVSTTAALLFVPYAIWVGYASALNFAIWRMN